MNERIRPVLISPKHSIRDAMIAITGVAVKNAPAGIALIVDDSNKLLGVVTDGDFRRAMVSGTDIQSPVEKIMVKDPITVPKGLSESEMLDVVRTKVTKSGRIRDTKVDKLIVVAQDGTVDDVIDFFQVWQGQDLRNRKVCVLGLGFVGLTFSAVLTEAGYKTVGYEINDETVRLINDGIAPFHEKGLSALLRLHVSRKLFRATQKIEESKADIYIVTVGTPVGADLKPDLKALERACDHIGGILKKKDLVILRSTVPVGTCRNLVLPLLEKRSGLKGGEDFYLCFAPERVVEGNALEELRTLPQVVGGLNQRSLSAGADFFSHINKTIVRMPSLESAEIVKLANNCFRDVSFAFANELARFCDQWDVNVNTVIAAANEGYPRNPIPVPSPGVGGTCLKKDPYLYAASQAGAGTELSLSLLGRRINESMTQHVLDKVRRHLEAHGRKAAESKVFIVGFAFKGEPETSDLRNSPTLDLVEAIRKAGVEWQLHGFDPVVHRQEIEKLGVRGAALRDGFKDADCVVFMNNHRSYRDIDLPGLADQMRKPGMLLDCWNLFTAHEVEAVDGIAYRGLGGSH